MYKLLASPQLEYCDVMFHTPATLSLFDSSISLTNLMQKLESTQYQAVSLNWYLEAASIENYGLEAYCLQEI